MAKSPFYLTDESLNTYYQFKLDSGVSPTAVGKYKNAADHLVNWLGDDRELTVLRLQEWRKFMESSGFSKNTVQTYVAVVNTFLKTVDRADLCIPKPIRNDLSGRTFGYLTALEPVEHRHHRYVVWRCRCRCGKEVEIPSSMLLRGCTTSCGCLNVEILQHRNRYEEGTELRQALEEKIINPTSASGYVGVRPKRGKYIAYITYKKKTYYLGTYSNIDDAIKARARAKETVMEDAARIYEETDHLYGASPRRPVPPEKIHVVPSEPTVIRARRANNTSGCPGVTRNQGKWSASICVNKYRYRLGAYEELEKAIEVRKQAEEMVKAENFDGLKAICTNRK